MSGKITVTYDIVTPWSGWEYDGIRQVELEELHFCGSYGWCVWQKPYKSKYAYPVAIRTKRWRPATEADVGRTDARFSDRSKSEWFPGKLVHIFANQKLPFAAVILDSSDVTYWEDCQVPISKGK